MPIGGPKAHVTLSMTRRGGPFLAASFGVATTSTV